MHYCNVYISNSLVNKIKLISNEGRILDPSVKFFRTSTFLKSCLTDHIWMWRIRPLVWKREYTIHRWQRKGRVAGFLLCLHFLFLIMKHTYQVERRRGNVRILNPEPTKVWHSLLLQSEKLHFHLSQIWAFSVMKGCYCFKRLENYWYLI